MGAAVLGAGRVASRASKLRASRAGAASVATIAVHMVPAATCRMAETTLRLVTMIRGNGRGNIRKG